MDTTDTAADSKERWPSVEPAYAFVLPSYQMLMSRFEAADNRISALLSLMSTLTLAVPVFARSIDPGVSFKSPLFIGGLLFFACGSAFGVWGRVTGSVTLPDPAVLYTDNLHKTVWRFQKDQIYRAGQHFAANAAAVEAKGGFALIVTVALLAEVAMFVSWLSFS